MTQERSGRMMKWDVYVWLRDILAIDKDSVE